MDYLEEKKMIQSIRTQGNGLFSLQYNVIESDQTFKWLFHKAIETNEMFKK